MPEQESLIFERRVTGHIYLVTNKVNGKQYVGQTIMSIRLRWRSHVNVAKSGAGYAISAAIRKYGEPSFTIEELAAATSYQELNALERHYIKSYGTISPRGYNLDFGGGAGERPPEIGAKISAAKRGKKTGPYPPRTAEHSRNLSEALKGRPSWWKGKKRSAKNKANLSAAKKGHPGHPHTEEFRANLRERNRGNKYGAGKACSPKRKIQISRMASARPRNGNGTFQKGKMPKLETFSITVCPNTISA